MAKGYRHLCMACYNAVISEHCGIEFQHPEFTPIRLTDVDGVVHEYQAIGFDPGGEILELYRELFEKMRRAMAQKHLRQGEFGLAIAEHQTVRARIDCDMESDEYDRRPLLVIDGKPVDWEQFGRMLMSSEGWQLKMEIHDKSEER